MRRIRVLVVDDAVAVRRLVSEALARDPAFDVVGTASNGRIALSKVPQLAPDALVLDSEMPELDGVQTIRTLRQSHPMMPVIMFSAHTKPGAVATLEALLAGASDYVTKPTSADDPGRAMEELVAKIKGALAALDAASPSPVRIPLREVPALGQDRRVDVVAIGLSTGGPNALALVVPEFGASLPVPLLITQHLGRPFTGLLADRLASLSGLPIKEGADGDTVSGGAGFLAPGDYHMVVVREASGVRLRTNQAPPENSCRPSVDVMLRAVAAVYGSHALAVIMTGLGQDGLRGCEAIREAGGQVLAQDQASSVVWGMPGAVAKAGLADKILPLTEIVPEIKERLRRGRSIHERSLSTGPKS